jgi:hypothetical protein
MKKRWPVWTFLAAVTCACSCRTFADDVTARKEIEKAYAEIARGVQRKDTSVMTRYTTKDYRQKGLGGGYLSRTQAFADIKESFAAASSLSMKTTISQLAVAGNTAVARIRWTMTMKTKPELDSTRKIHTVVALVPLKHIWVKTPGGWRMKQAEELPGAAVTVDGKPQAPNRS